MAVASLIEIAARVLRELPVSLDRLPYTPAFDLAHQRFNQLAGKEVAPDEVWWYLLHARKRGLGRPSRRRRRSAKGASAD